MALVLIALALMGIELTLLVFALKFMIENHTFQQKVFVECVLKNPEQAIFSVPIAFILNP